MKTCCVTGHRDIPAEMVASVKRRLKKEIELAIRDGYTRFLSGFAAGSDLYFAEEVKALLEEGVKIQLEAAIPYQNRYEALMKNPQTRALMLACTEVRVLSESYAPNVYSKRNRYLVVHQH